MAARAEPKALLATDSEVHWLDLRFQSTTLCKFSVTISDSRNCRRFVRLHHSELANVCGYDASYDE